MDTLCGTTNIQMIFDFCPRVLKHFVGYRSNIVLYAVFEPLRIVVFDLVDEVRYHPYNPMPGIWIGRGVPSAESLRSPDLTTLDFFLWGYVNSFVYQVKNNDQQLKARIRPGVTKAKHNVLQTRGQKSNIVWIFVVTSA
jgi:hypothetical protein